MEHVHVLSELDRSGIAYQWASDAEVKCLCPFHDDSTPSLFINVEKNVFKCQTAGCGAEGDFIDFLARKLQTSRAVILADLSTRYVFDSVKIVDIEVVERWHQCIWAAGPLLKALHDRGVTDELIRKYRLGENEGRVTIPVPNEGGHYVNVRKYLPGAPGDKKMKNMKGRSKPRLFPIAQMEYDTIVLCGGEMKAIVAAEQLNRHGIGAVCVTAGEGGWIPELTPRFSGKTVYVLLDIDEAGVKAAEVHATRLSTVAVWVGIAKLPLDIDKYPHGDINDFVSEGGSLKRVLNDVEQWIPKTLANSSDEPPEDMHLSAAINANQTGKRVRVKAVVAAMDTAPYIIPRDITVTCDRSQQMCTLCPVFGSGVDKFTIPSESPAIMEMVATHRDRQRDAIMNGLGIPRTCKVCDFVADSFYNVEDARISPELEITNRSADRVMQPALCIGPGLDMNEPYMLTGRMHPHPKTQQSTLLISNYGHAQDALSTYEVKNLDHLDAFQPEEWTVESIEQKLNTIYEDLEANVTRIYQRRDLHLTVDLAYHSPLLFYFDGSPDPIKGWVEVCVVGDSAQGKTETAVNLMKHYGLGTKIECKNASVAGMLGGLQQNNGRFFVTWGIIPTHDKRLVILEELKGANVEVIAKLTDMRSSGIAEIPKIEKRRKHARTRLVALSNPRSDHPLSAYNFGVQAIKELIGSLEDVRRFDFALLVGKGELDPNVINQLQGHRPHVPHSFTNDLCRELVLWAWTRKEGQVKWDAGVEAIVLEEATRLSKEFTDAIPLVDRGSTRYKIARLAASLAARTFSCTDDHQSILVRECHVRFISQFISRVYNSRVFGYGDFTAAISLTTTLLDPKEIKKRIVEVPFPGDFLRQMLHTETLDINDIQDWCSWQYSDARNMLSFLVRKHALMRDSRSYRKTPEFISLLREVIDKKEYSDRPDHIAERF